MGQEAWGWGGDIYVLVSILSTISCVTEGKAPICSRTQFPKLQSGQ